MVTGPNTIGQRQEQDSCKKHKILSSLSGNSNFWKRRRNIYSLELNINETKESWVTKPECQRAAIKLEQRYRFNRREIQAHIRKIK
jgi:hypothetical protein